MPSLVRSQKWFCRVTVPHVVAKEFMHKLTWWVDLKQILVCTHVGNRTEKEHFHAVITLSSEIQKQSFDVRIKNIYGVRGADYSSKPWDGSDSACSYLFHDPSAEIILNKGYSEEDILRYRKLNDDVQKVIEVNNSRASGRHVDKVIALIAESNSRWSRMEIMNEFIRKIREGEMYEPGDFLLKRYVEEVYLKTLEDDELEDYTRSRYHNLFEK